MDRRGFLKLITGAAALPLVGKYFKFAKPAVTAVETVKEGLKAEGMPSFFYDIVAGVKKFGKQTKSERDYNVYEYTHPKTKQKVQIYDGPDEVGVNFTTDRESGATMLVRKGKADELTKGKRPPDEYFEYEDVYRAHGPDDYYKDFQEEITGGYQGLADLAKKLKGETFASGGRIGLEGGGSTGQPPISYQTDSPKEALKFLLGQMIGGSGIQSVPIYQGDNLGITGGMGVGQFRPFDYGIGINYGDLGASFQTKDGSRSMGLGYQADPNLSFGASYTPGMDRGPSIGIQYQKQFANGGLTDTIPPKRGPMSQGVESLFIKR